MNERPPKEALARMRVHAERVPVLGAMTRACYRAISRRPALHRALRPLAYRAVVWLRPLLRWLYIAGNRAITVLMGWVELPLAASRFLLAWYGLGRNGVGRQAQGRTIVMVVVADMRVDPRVQREARALAAGGFQVHVIWTDPQLGPGGQRPEIDWGENITFEALPRDAGRFSSQFPGFLGGHLLRAALAHRPFAFHGHDLNTALVVLTAARRTGAHAVCDFHEWYSENVTFSPLSGIYRPHSLLQKAVYRWLERMSFRHGSALVTVCDSIAEEMKRDLGDGRLDVAVVRNIPDRSREPSRAYPPLKQQYGIADDRFVLLWQGGVGPSRMIEPVVEALALAPGCTLVIRGPEIDTYGPGYAAIAARIGASDRLILAPAVPSRDVVAAGRGADAGVWTLPNLCKNFTYALPNKIFEYLASGLPVMVAHHPEAKRLIESYEVGLDFDPYDPRSIAAAINRLSEDRPLRERLAANTGPALARLDADAEWRKLAVLYEGLSRESAGHVSSKPLDAPTVTG